MENEKTFTQEQVNAIVGKRLAEQKASMDQDLVNRESAVVQREMSIKAKEMLQEKNLPLSLAEVLKYDSEESLVSAIESIGHLQGFSQNSEAKNDKKIIENKLAVGNNDGRVPDAVRTAMGLN